MKPKAKRPANPTARKRPVIRFGFDDGERIAVPLAQVQRTVILQTVRFADTTGNWAPFDAAIERIAADTAAAWAQAGARARGTRTTRQKALERDRIPRWADSAFRVAYDGLVYEGRKRIGRSRLATETRRLYPAGDARRNLISQHLARLWLEQHRDK